ncbi:MAG TPA: hypothetical protein VK669_11710 [Candidatus Limnocylindrales bacterium]|nr:hypothetical protein [Candidatus Limnocylindrales bacterium]
MDAPAVPDVAKAERASRVVPPSPFDDLPVPRPTTDAQIEGFALAFAENPDGLPVVDLSDWPSNVLVRDMRPNHKRRDGLLGFAQLPASCRCGDCAAWGSYAKVVRFPYRGKRCVPKWAAIYKRAVLMGVAVHEGPTLDDWGNEYDPREMTKADHREIIGKLIVQHGGAAVGATGVPILEGGYKRMRRDYDKSLYYESVDFYDLARDIMLRYPQKVRAPGARGNKGYSVGAHLFLALVFVYHRKSIAWASGWCNEFLGKRVDGYIGMRFPNVSASCEFLRKPETVLLLDDLLLETARTVEPLGGMLRIGTDGSGEGVTKWFDYLNDRRPRKSGGEITAAGKPGRREVSTREDGIRVVSPYWTVVALSCIDTLMTAAVDTALGPVGESPRAVALLDRVLPHLANKGDYAADTAHQDAVRRKCIEFGWLPRTRYVSTVVEPKDDALRALYLAFAQNPRLWKEQYNDRYKEECLFSVVHGQFGAWVRVTAGAGADCEIRLKFLANNLRMLAKMARVYRVPLAPDSTKPGAA